MPRGKFVNHKGRSRHFTSPEELQNQSSDEEESTAESGSEEEDEAAGAAGATAAGTSAKLKTKTKTKREPKKSTTATSSDEDSDEESSEGEDVNARKGVASLIEIENPNRVVKKATQKLKTLKLEDGDKPVKPELTRREREQIEKQQARARYEKLHAAGKTREAKADLARLALIRQQRAEAAAKREAEKKAAEEKKAKAGDK